MAQEADWLRWYLLSEACHTFKAIHHLLTCYFSRKIVALYLHLETSCLAHAALLDQKPYRSVLRGRAMARGGEPSTSGRQKSPDQVRASPSFSGLRAQHPSKQRIFCSATSGYCVVYEGYCDESCATGSPGRPRRALAQHRHSACRCLVLLLWRLDAFLAHAAWLHCAICLCNAGCDIEGLCMLRGNAARQNG